MIRIIPHCFRSFQILMNSALFRKVKIKRKICTRYTPNIDSKN